MVGHRILNLRKEHNLTQTDLSKILGIGRTAIHGYENNKINPPPDKLLKLAEFFDVSVDYLVGKSPKRNTIVSNSVNCDIKQQLQDILESLHSPNTVHFQGKRLSQKEKQILITCLSSNLTIIETLLHDLEN